jgi:hypothetical protein
MVWLGSTNEPPVSGRRRSSPWVAEGGDGKDQRATGEWKPSSFV